MLKKTISGQTNKQTKINVLMDPRGGSSSFHISLHSQQFYILRGLFKTCFWIKGKEISQGKAIKKKMFHLKNVTMKHFSLLYVFVFWLTGFSKTNMDLPSISFWHKTMLCSWICSLWGWKKVQMNTSMHLCLPLPQSCGLCEMAQTFQLHLPGNDIPRSS